MMLHISYQELYKKFLNENESIKVSVGTFNALRPFYIRTQTEKDIEMCCCITHLHARWAIEGILESAKLQNIQLPFSNYSNFFEWLYSNCLQNNETTYLHWECTPDNKNTCSDITDVWEATSNELVKCASPEVVVKILSFEKIDNRLKPILKSKSMKGIIDFMAALLPKIIHHRNHLRHYRNSITTFRENFNAVFIDIDFSENLSIPVHKEPQSLHWQHEQVSVHSAIVKHHGCKEYHPYLSDDKKHDQKFVKVALSEILETITDQPTADMCIVESDNCASQYKSAEHFYDIQSLSNESNMKIIRVFGVAGHGKGEVDHVGGLAKVAIRRYVGTGGVVLNAEDCIHVLQEKFADKNSPKFCIKKITEESLRDVRKNQQFPTVPGSSRFQVMIFTPNSDIFKAAPHMCLCDNCLHEYGSCNLFQVYDVPAPNKKPNPPRLRSATPELFQNDIEVIDTGLDVVVPESICAVAAANLSNDSFWLIEVCTLHAGDDSSPHTDDYGHTIPPGVSYIEGHFLEREYETTKGTLYKSKHKTTFFYKESVIYPLVKLEKLRNGLFLNNKEKIHIMKYIEGIFHD